MWQDNTNQAAECIISMFFFRNLINNRIAVLESGAFENVDVVQDIRLENNLLKEIEPRAMVDVSARTMWV